MKTKTLISISAIVLIILSYLVMSDTRPWDDSIPDTDDTMHGKISYSLCCRNVDGYCLDLFESANNRCGNNTFVSNELCGDVQECELHCCFIDGIKQNMLMTQFECEKLYKDIEGANSWNWDMSCNTI